MKKVKLLVLALFFSLLFGMTAMASGSVTGDVELKTEKVHTKAVLDGKIMEGEVDTSLHYGAISGASQEFTEEMVKKLTNSQKKFATYIHTLWLMMDIEDEWGDIQDDWVDLASDSTIELEFSVVGVTSKTEVYVLDYAKGFGWNSHGKVIEKGNGYIKVRLSSLKGVTSLAILVEKESGSQGSALAPAAVPELKPTTTAKVNVIDLKWDAVAGATRYEIRYGTSPDFNQAKKLTSTKKTSYQFKKAKCGVDYYFWIQAGNKIGRSAWTASEEALRTSLIGSPVVTVKKQTYNSISLKWTKVDGAKKYMVYRVNEEGLTFLKTQSGTSYTDKKLNAGENYYYVVRPVRDQDYGENNTSEMVVGRTVLQRITRLKAKVSGTDSIRLSWKKVPGVVKYEIYRLDEKTGEYELLHNNGIRTSYRDAGLEAGKTYSYKVIGWTPGDRKATSTLCDAEIVRGTTKHPK